jgi:hypothetical protein
MNDGEEAIINAQGEALEYKRYLEDKKEKMHIKKKMSSRTKNDVIDEIAVILKQDRSLSFFASLKGWRKEWLQDILEILKTKEILLLPIDKEEEWELCERCIHHKKTAFGMNWCDASRTRVDDYEHEKHPGDSIPTFEYKGSPELSMTNKCTHYEEQMRE